MHKKFFFGLFIVFFNTTTCSEPFFNVLYPFTSFKSIVDTCMRSYTDVLLIQDRIYSNEKIDEQVDLLVGRLMRLKSYIDQAIFAYRFEATVTYDELEYLLRMLDYLEITLNEQKYRHVYDSLNVIICDFKKQIRHALDIQLAWMKPSFSWSSIQFAFGNFVPSFCITLCRSNISFSSFYLFDVAPTVA